MELDPNHYVYYSYDSFGRITSKQQRRTATGGTVFGKHTYTYHGGSGANSTSSVISSVTLHSGTTFNYSYSNLEYINTIKEGSTTKQTFAYDSLGQLTRENNAYTGKTYVYTYDVAGNKTSKKTYAYTTGTVGTVQSTETYSYGSTTNTRNRLTNYNGTSISYDGVGNPTNWRNSSSLTWEGKDLKSVYLGAIGGVNYTYTAEGLRTQKAQSYYGLTVNYYYDSNDNLIYEERTRSSGTERLHYQYDANGIMGLIYTNASGSITALLVRKNAQGDVVDIYNGNGVHVARYNYDEPL